MFLCQYILTYRLNRLNQGIDRFLAIANGNGYQDMVGLNEFYLYMLSSKASLKIGRIETYISCINQDLSRIKVLSQTLPIHDTDAWDLRQTVTQVTS